jgi:NAD(P)-dependent dehydrogenase (short-subunit alcohol dehydrogenase family)
MAAEGAKIVVADVGIKDGTHTADLTVDQIKQAGGEAVADYSDITLLSGGESLTKTAVDNFGRLDILVNCAGFTKSCPIIDTEEKDWDSIIAVHTKGHFSTIRAAAKQMISQGEGGRIINFSSRASFVDVWAPGMTSIAYSTAKAGIVGLTTLCSLEFKQYGITCNAILPSAVTPGFPEERPKFGGGLTQGPEFVAPVLGYLATDDAKDITGQFIYATGGDIGVLAPPLRLEGNARFAFKDGKWTIDELANILPRMCYYLN